KSSLMNRLVEQKLSIVTPFAQTTRERVLGIDTREDAQMIFVDTPGLVDPRYLLHRAMLHAAVDAIADADVLLLLIDAAAEVPEFADEVLELVRRHPNRVVIANKTDVAPAGRVARVKEWAQSTFGTEAVEVSAETGTGVGELRAEIVRRLPVSPFLFPEDDISSQSVRFFVSEFIRETVFEQYEKEVPYSIAVKVDEYRETAEPIYIRATLYVERATQKAILIGSGGAAIKRLGSAARLKIEEFVGASVYLDLWVKVLPRWRKDPLQLQRLGFKLPTTEQSP
ncbi:MAG TPA: GTPase Era, partial [Longimicrobiaceae bacterium]|nr:GTPase Era [Longimicrobiaceae bacterium]